MSALSEREKKRAEKQKEKERVKEKESQAQTWEINGWWLSTSTRDLLQAERRFIDAYVDSDRFAIRVHDVHINYDVTPVRERLEAQRKALQAMEKELASNKQCQTRRHSLFGSLFSWGSKSSKSEPTKQSLMAHSSSVHPSGTVSSVDLLRDRQRNQEEAKGQEEDAKRPLQSNIATAKSPPHLSQDDTAEQRDPRLLQHIHTVTLRQRQPKSDQDAIDDVVEEVLPVSESVMERKVDPKDDVPPVVLLHGYGCAGGIFYPCINSLMDNFYRKLRREDVTPDIHVLDWLGHGASSRPTFHSKYSVEDAENWFVDSLEAWRRKMNIRRMVLVGHSLGGYMSAVYAIRYPESVAQLILVSPVGVPNPPEDRGQGFIDNMDWKRRFMFRTFRALWDGGWTPHDILRMSGPKGRDWLTKAVTRRLFRVDDESPLKSLLANYLYHCYAGPGSGEYALNKVLLPGAWAVKPLRDRIPRLKERQTAEEDVPLRIDAVFGQTDWMSPNPFIDMKQREECDVEVHYIRDAGHQMILEQPERFGRLIGRVVAKQFRKILDARAASVSDSESGSEVSYVGRKLGDVAAEVASHKEQQQRESEEKGTN